MGHLTELMYFSEEGYNVVFSGGHNGEDGVDIYFRSDLTTYLLMRCRALILWLSVGPTGVYLLVFFCSGIQFYLLLSSYLCFISFLYLDLCVL